MKKMIERNDELSRNLFLNEQDIYNMAWKFSQIHEHGVAWWEPATCYISTSSICYHHIQSFLLSWSISLSLSRTHVENWTLTHWVMSLIELRILSVLNSLALSLNLTWASITLEIVQWTAWVCFPFCVQKEHSLINEPTGQLEYE